MPSKDDATKLRVNIDLDRELWHKVSIQAAIEQRDKRDIVEQALKEYLAKKP